MKRFLKNIISLLNEYILSCKNNITIIKSKTLFVKSNKFDKSNLFHIENSILQYTSFYIQGLNNRINIKGNHSNLKIKIFGNYNEISIDAGTKSYYGEFIIRGNNCRVKIGEKTTLGKNNYIVCMGKENEILIGENNMFADNIDIWNTDSHPIYDDKSGLLNYSKPVKIGNHVWVGKYVCILKGSIIEDNSVIGMRSLVSGQHIIHNTLNIGSPTRCIRTDINWDRKFTIL